jgi:hypothetical protein
MPIIVGLLAIGVSHAIDKYQERQAAKNAGIDSHDQDTSFGLSFSTSMPISTLILLPRNWNHLP